MKKDIPKLVAQAKNGDAHAFALLYEDIYKDLYRFAFCMMKQAEQAEDAVSSAVLHAYEHLHKLRKNTSFRSWMFQITANECKKQLRLQSKVSAHPADQVLETASYAVDYEGKFFLKQAMALLGETERLIVGLNIFGGYNSREIARYLHKKEGTIRSSKSRALEKMRAFLGGTNPDGTDSGRAESNKTAADRSTTKTKQEFREMR